VVPDWLRTQGSLSLFCGVFIALLLLFDRPFIPLFLGASFCVVTCILVDLFLVEWFDSDVDDAGSLGGISVGASDAELHFVLARL
jgi:hypothetical protein